MMWDALIVGKVRTLDMVGEFAYTDATLRHFPTPPDGNPRTYDATLELVPEPTNPHDSLAIAVRAGGATIAYVARKNNQRLQPILRRINNEGGRVLVPANIWIVAGGGRNRPGVNIQISLPKLDDIYPMAIRQKSSRPTSPQPAPTTQVPRSGGGHDLIVFILAVLLGWLGVDRFVNQQYGLGLLKLVTVGGAGIWWLVDIVIFGWRWMRPLITPKG